MSSHPNALDQFIKFFDPHYLFPTQNAKLLSKLSVAVIQKTPDIHPYWKTLDYFTLSANTQLKFLGVCKSLNIKGDVNDNDLVFEIQKPIFPPDYLKGKAIQPGDTIAIRFSDRQAIMGQ